MYIREMRVCRVCLGRYGKVERGTAKVLDTSVPHLERSTVYKDGVPVGARSTLRVTWPSMRNIIDDVYRQPFLCTSP